MNKVKESGNKAIGIAMAAIMLALIFAVITPASVAKDVPPGEESIFYLIPRDSSAPGYCNNTTVDIWLNTTISAFGMDFTLKTGNTTMAGQLATSTSDTSCANIVKGSYEHNDTYFPEHAVHVDDGSAFKIESRTPNYAEQPPGVYHIGNLSIHCNSTEKCVTNLSFVPNVPFTYTTNTSGDTNSAVENGTFTCAVEEEAPINVDIRADSITGNIFNVSSYTVNSGTVTEDNITINNQTAMGAVVAYCQDNGINVNITMGSYGEWLIQIGNNASDKNNWMYAVNETVPGVGGAAYDLSGGEKVHWFNYMLNYYTVLTTLDKTSIYPGDSITATVMWTNLTGTHLLNGAEVFVSDTAYMPGSSVGTTGADGNVTFEWSTSGTWYVYAVDPLHGSGIYNYPPVSFTCIATTFDTGKGTYPSIFGTHNGTITPNKDISVNRIYTYPCKGTGGHTEFAMIWNETRGECIEAHWNGYVGDYHNISFNTTLTLRKGVVYNYTICTGSYPQIHHTPALPTANGWMNCTKFTDANGKSDDKWIPAIRLFYEE